MDSEFDAVSNTFGAVDTRFLARSIRSLDPTPPVLAQESDSIKSVIESLQDYDIGCVLIVNKEGVITGIFSERDVLMEICLSDIDLEATAISEVMVGDPKTVAITATIAYALHLMSDGGYRHLPLVDEKNKPVGIISVKDILEFIESKFIDELVSAEIKKK